MNYLWVKSMANSINFYQRIMIQITPFILISRNLCGSPRLTLVVESGSVGYRPISLICKL